MGSVTRKGPYGPESVWDQKKDGRAWPRPYFFWYDTDVLDLFIYLFLSFFFNSPLNIPAIGLPIQK